MSAPATGPSDNPAMEPGPEAMPAGAPSMGSGPSDGAGPGQQPFHSASLYVGDLAPDVNEGLLFEIFNAVGPVASIRVCRDAVTRRSLGYAYVNFHQLSDAERALDTMNFTMIKSKPCRIMWSQRDPSLRRSGVGNIFVKNLHESIDNKQLYDTFSLFGNILSCKVVTDRESGSSKGYGYVHYETAEAATAAIEKLDGMLIDGQEVQVGHFMRRNERPGQNDWTNCYVKKIPYEWDDARLKEEFAQFGEVMSASIARGVRKPHKKPTKNGDGEKKEEDEPKDDAEEQDKAWEAMEKTENKEGDSKDQSLGFGFVNFLEHEAAVAAVEALNGKEYDTNLDGEDIKQELYVGRAQKKAERERELRAKFEAEKMDRISKFQGVNLYIKNLDDGVTDDMLRDEFSSMGTITSARVMKDMKDGRSRGFGFVCFSSPEEATRAVNEMNGKIVANKPIFVALAQRREVRRAQLEAQHANRAGGPGQGGMMRNPMGGPMGYPGPGMPMYMQRPGPGSMQPAYPMMPQMMGGPGGRGQQPRGVYPMMGQQGRGGYPMPYGVMAQNQGRGGRGMQPGRGGRGGRGPGGPMQQGRGPQGGQPIKFNQQARNAGPQQGAMPQGGMQQGPPQPPPQQPPMPHEGALTASALASATPEMQKNMIGERLYPLIHQSQPELAGKITGMLLEMDNSELLHLLESPEALNAKISEALQVLEAHQAENRNPAS
ncbi:Polyadenylate-binding protein, cytoplasmic and nuclear [Seminavis robusta]|uniref:Polyadenylate-binding protein, cytoplasmic and nuclear n=1 Tax=Seminavis robusta TaxID=568900 RepID=A0A9N8EM36_9STRA|nr:Polyadenylate-binding protein, cytoplasmic and nuclear [Seminavis robusta]|eukprot:Sro1157_g247340.1 Polyadenylate-binding protein, cytoplasmic and nuclear (714) ;mRNA; r:6030-8171